MNPESQSPKRRWNEISPSRIAGGCFFQLAIRLVVVLGAVASVTIIVLLAINEWLSALVAVGGSMVVAGFWIGIVGIGIQWVASSKFKIDATGRKMDRFLGFGLMLLILGGMILAYAVSMPEP